MKIKRILAISDIHGCYNEFNKLLGKVHYDSSKDQLILLGDYVDRGKDSKKVVEFVKELVYTYGAIALRGNHDQLFLDFLKKDDYWATYNFLRNGGLSTLESYGDATKEGARDNIWFNYPEHIDFLDDLPYYYETEEYIFVHAGVNVFLENWKNTIKDEFIWIREQFLDYDHNADKTIVFGHTPTINLQSTEDIYFGNMKIGIDGGCTYGFQLNCLEISDEGLKQHDVWSEKKGLGSK